MATVHALDEWARLGENPRFVSMSITPPPTPDPAAVSAERRPSAATWSWVPVRSLSSRHRGRVADHLQQLASEDRYLRFGYPATDEQIGLYVDCLDFERDEVFGIFNRRLQLVAMAHLAHQVASDAKSRCAEFGVSVLPRYRGRGFGRRLFEHATLHARNRGVATLIIHALSENRAMLRIVRRAGAVVQTEGSESSARLTLPADTWASHAGEIAGQQAAEFDYRVKQQALHLNGLIDAVSEVREQLSETGIASE